MTSFDVVEITTPAALADLAPAWWALFDRCEAASPFQSPAWLLAWVDAFRPPQLWTVAVRREGALLGLAPFFVYARPDDGRRQVTLLGNGVTDRLDLLAEPGAGAAVAAAAIAHLERHPERWECCDFRDVPQPSALLAIPLTRPAQDTVVPDTPCPVLRLPNAPSAVVRALPRKARENIERRARRLAERGRVSFGEADADDLDASLAAIVDLHGSRWRSRGEAGVLDDAAVQRFHGRAARALLARGLLRLHVLRLDGAVVAAHYGLRRGRRAYSYLHGFDPAFAAYSPSTLLIAHAMEEAVRTGAETFDFLRGQEPYKYAWGALDEPQSRRRIET